MKKIICIAIAFLLFSFIGLMGNIWESTGSLNEGRRSFSSVIFDNGDILVAGGIGNPSVVLSSCEIYHTSTGIWSITDSMNFVRRDFSLIKFRHDGLKKILAMGGTQSLVGEIFDSQSQMWEDTGSMHYWRLEAPAIAFPDPNNNENDLILIVGGDCENDYTTCEIYDPATGSFTLTGSLPEGKSGSKLVYNPDLNVIMAIGGWGTNGMFSYHDCQIYDITTGTWTQIDPTDNPRHRHTAIYNEKNATVLVIGSSYSPHNSCELYDFTTGEWSIVDSLEIGRWNHCSNILLNSQTLVIGGSSDQIGAGTTCEIYDEIIGWQIAAPLIGSIVNNSSEVLKDETVLAIGQYNSQIYTWNYMPITQLQGPNSGIIGEELNFSVVATDPDGDSVSVRIDWGDESSDWTELVPSGTTMEFSHSWNEAGQYEIRTQSADQWYFLNELCHNSLSEWTNPTIVTITGIPEIQLSADSLNFGSVYIGQDSTMTITITNTGNGILEVNLETNTVEFSVCPESFNLEPEESLDVEITFTPIYEGVVTDTLVISSNDPENPEIEVFLTGEGKILVGIDNDEISTLNSIKTYPNPFNDYITISFSTNLAQVRPGQNTEITVFNIKGQVIKTWTLNQTTLSVVWNGKDSNGKKLANGIYFCKHRIGGLSSTKKIILLK